MPILHSMRICALKASWTCGNGAPVTESCGSIYYVSLNAPHLLQGHVYAYITLNSPCVHFGHPRHVEMAHLLQSHVHAYIILNAPCVYFKHPRCVGMAHLLQSHVHAYIMHCYMHHVCTSGILDAWEWCTCSMRPMLDRYE